MQAVTDNAQVLHVISYNRVCCFVSEVHLLNLINKAHNVQWIDPTAHLMQGWDPSIVNWPGYTEVKCSLLYLISTLLIRLFVAQAPLVFVLSCPLIKDLQGRLSCDHA